MFCDFSIYFLKKKRSIEDETTFCDPEVLQSILKSKVCDVPKYIFWFLKPFK